VQRHVAAVSQHLDRSVWVVSVRKAGKRVYGTSSIVKAAGEEIWGIDHVLERHATAAIEMLELFVLQHFRTLALRRPVVFTKTKVQRGMLVSRVFSGLSLLTAAPH
jgi:hypothetical protein